MASANVTAANTHRRSTHGFMATARDRHGHWGSQDQESGAVSDQNSRRTFRGYSDRQEMTRFRTLIAIPAGMVQLAELQAVCPV